MPTIVLPHSDPKHIVAVSGAFFNKQGQILLVRTERRGWECPGGQVEEGEDLIYALVREVREETGCQVEVERLRLRPAQESDKAERLAFGRDAEFRKMVGGDPRACPPLTEVEVQEWYDRVCAEPLHWIIEVEGHCIGTVRLHGLDLENRRARYAIGIYSPNWWGKGYGTQATRLVLEYAFEILRLHRVDLKVLAFNHRAIACYEKCGFVREGIEREGALIAGEWQSDVLMSILEQEYEALCRTLQTD